MESRDAIFSVLLLAILLVAGCAANTNTNVQQASQGQQNAQNAAGTGSSQPPANPAATQQQAKETISVGIIAPLTTNAVELGQDARDAILLAIDEVNKAGGINGQALKPIVEDGKCSAEAAGLAANKLVNVDKVPVIFGGLCSAETLAAVPVVEGKTVLISGCSSNPKLTGAGNYVFRTYPSDAFQGKFAAEYAYNTIGARNAALLSCLSDWCVGVKDVFKARFKELGGSIAAEEEFEQGTKDMKTQLTKVKAASPDLIYMPAYTNEVVVGLQQAQELGITTRFLGADAWSDKTIPQQVGDFAQGKIFVQPKLDSPDSFKSAFKARYGHDPSLCAPGSYDAVKIVVDAMKKVGLVPSKIKDELHKVTNYVGVAGTYGLDAKGDRTSANYAVYTFKENEIVEAGQK